MGKSLVPGLNDLASVNPALLAEWDYEKNFPLLPQNVASKSHRKVFWLCPKGHSFDAAISNRSNGKGCPVCVGRKLVAGINDLATVNPSLAAEWDFERNAPLTPQEITAGIRQKIYWLCPKGHSYQSLVFNRTMGNGCPICDNKRLLAGFNDLATINPSLAAEWDYQKNAPLTPQEVLSAVKQTVYWLCPERHSYDMSINDRSTGNNCPVCSGKRVIAGVNDLATVNPELAAEWDFERNSPKTPSEVSSGAGTKAFWLCPLGHSFRSVIGSRHSGRGCPVCAETGYDPSQTGLFYFIENQNLRARKVGITNPDRRYDRLAHFGHEWKIIESIRDSNGEIIRQLESIVLKWIRRDNSLPAYLGKAEMGSAGGHSETFSEEGVSNEDVLSFISKTYASLKADNS